MKKCKVFHRRNLPHLQPKGAIFFVTYLLHGALPSQLKVKLQNEYELKLIQCPESTKIEGKRHFKRFDEALHNEASGTHWLKEESLAQKVVDNLHLWDNKRFELIAYCIMSNHVHVVFRPFEKNEEGKPLYLQQIMHTLKLFTAKACNKHLGIKGKPFWQSESYDRVVRDKAELHRIISYVLDNPVKAGLCKNRKDWPWSYVKSAFNEFM